MKDFVVLGRVSGHYGLKGWLKVNSHTRPGERIFAYAGLSARNPDGGDSPLELAVERFSVSGEQLLVKFRGLDNREQTQVLLRRELGVTRDRLEKLPEGEFYWRDLVGLTVLDRNGVTVGRVKSLLETGANDVLVIESGEDGKAGREWLVPWARPVILAVDLEGGCITLDWDFEAD